jgi:hypothetical protein
MGRPNRAPAGRRLRIAEGRRAVRRRVACDLRGTARRWAREGPGAQASIHGGPRRHLPRTTHSSRCQGIPRGPRWSRVSPQAPPRDSRVGCFSIVRRALLDYPRPDTHERHTENSVRTEYGFFGSRSSVEQPRDWTLPPCTLLSRAAIRPLCPCLLSPRWFLPRRCPSKCCTRERWRRPELRKKHRVICIPSWAGFLQNTYSLTQRGTAPVLLWVEPHCPWTHVSGCVSGFLRRSRVGPP